MKPEETEKCRVKFINDPILKCCNDLLTSLRSNGFLLIGYRTREYIYDKETTRRIKEVEKNRDDYIKYLTVYTYDVLWIHRNNTNRGNLHERQLSVTPPVQGKD